MSICISRASHSCIHSGNRGAKQNGVGITMYAPNMNLVRDPRWGRAQEVYSEDPCLSGMYHNNMIEMAIRCVLSLSYLSCHFIYLFINHVTAGLTYNFVDGAQRNVSTPYMLAAACCKHYAAYDLESIPEDRYFFRYALEIIMI